MASHSLPNIRVYKMAVCIHSFRFLLRSHRLLQSWGAICHGQAASGSWTGPRLHWHVSCLELLAVFLALRRFLSILRDKHVLVRTDNTAAIAYINHQGGLRSRRMSQFARHLLLWSRTQLKSLRAVLIPVELNRAAEPICPDMLACQHLCLSQEGTETLRPLASILNYAECRLRGDWAPKYDTKYVTRCNVSIPSFRLTSLGANKKSSQSQSFKGVCFDDDDEDEFDPFKGSRQQHR
ncbi:ORF V: Enzymatic polyprotein [Labeo rohita]|uniref:ORF V: Enzymatic polyprotein n=1 Tax=Labeo rohita TaxID=84645 RepID=A0ABQ8LZC9_LABRO|nr:ORF V: Enzymatic polyprotein [Labeo rohita]